jgi:hypothetical protein
VRFPSFRLFFTMRFNTAVTALATSATLMGYAHAEEVEAVPDATTAIEKPTFTVRFRPTLETNLL